jgi:hypothetical protein
MGLRPLAGWDCGFEPRRCRGCLFLVSVVCCQVEVFATDRSLLQRNPTECVYVFLNNQTDALIIQIYSVI